MRRQLGYGVLFLGSLALVACGGSKEEKSGEVVETASVDPKKNPLAALAKAAEAAQDAGKRMEEAAKRPPVEAVKFDVLLPFLPEAPAGFTAEEPTGSTSSMGEYKVTVVSRRYHNEAGDASLNVEITDGAYNEMVYMPFRMMSQFSTESTEGYQRGITLAGDQPGFETWNKASKTAELTALVGDRFVVHLKGDGIPESALRDWLKDVKLAEIAAVGK